MYHISLMLFLLFISTGYLGAQEKFLQERKIYSAQRIQKKPKIDGILNEHTWQQLPAASDFVMYDPGDGRPAPETYNTQVKLGYTDEALYIGAFFEDPVPQTIRRQFAQRDNIPVADYFVFDINTYNDGENQTRFVVTAAGTLADAKMTGENEDYAYDVVWNAEVSIGDRGWFLEMRIPYAALRFPDKDKQMWSIQMFRRISHRNETYAWNYIDKSVGKSTDYNGLLKGISDISPPVRLSLYPYISGVVENFEGKTTTSFSAGMDLKYGISDAFTLDATLIPDFGQTAYDEVELNLGPFEQTYGEKRAFFTEGTELFSKGGLFYSRRIGSTPTRFEEVSEEKLEEEIVIKNPDKTNLINAIKISGRTDRGLGIGFLNAATEKTEALLKNRQTGQTREIVTEPFANYNILVLDQRLGRKSSLSLINTNVTREGHFGDANVTGFLFDLYNRSSSYNLQGEAKMSNINLARSNPTGFASTLSLSRTKGRFRYGISHDFANQTYDINDLGVNYTNNYNNFFWSTSYRIFEPSGIFNQYNIRLYGNHQRRYQPDISVRSGIGSSFFGMTRERFAFGGFLDINTKYRDFFEPRRNGYFVLYNPNTIGDIWISSDYRDRFAVDARIGYSSFFDSKTKKLNLSFSPRWRVNNRFLLIYGLEYLQEKDRESFVDLIPQHVIFGIRDTESVENSLQGTYNFSTKSAVSLSFRNFWSSAGFADEEFLNLRRDGSLAPFDYEVPQDEDPDANFNIWNLDLSYQWRFAPGSKMILLYRNSIFNLDDKSDLEYAESLSNLFQQPARHNVSLRLVYYFEYDQLENIIKS